MCISRVACNRLLTSYMWALWPCGLLLAPINNPFRHDYIYSREGSEQTSTSLSSFCPLLSNYLDHQSITLGSMGFHKAMTASWLSWTTYVFVDLNTSKCIHEYLQGALHALFTSQLSCAVEINRLKVVCVCAYVCVCTSMHIHVCDFFSYITRSTLFCTSDIRRWGVDFLWFFCFALWLITYLMWLCHQ